MTEDEIVLRNTLLSRELSQRINIVIYESLKGETHGTGIAIDALMNLLTANLVLLCKNKNTLEPLKNVLELLEEEFAQLSGFVDRGGSWNVKTN